MFFESLFEGSFRFADVTGVTVLTRQLVYYNLFCIEDCIGSWKMMVVSLSSL